MLQPVQVNSANIKPNDEGSEQSNVGQQRDGDEDTFPVLVECPEGDVGQEGKREQQAAEETEDVGDVVDPRQKAAQEKEEHDARQFRKGFPGLLQHLPTLKQLNKEASEEPKLRPRWTHLSGERESEKKPSYTGTKEDSCSMHAASHSVHRKPKRLTHWTNA